MTSESDARSSSHYSLDGGSASRSRNSRSDNATSNFHTRISERARVLNAHLMTESMQTQVVSQIFEGREISYGFEQLQVFRNFQAVTRAIQFARSGEFTADLVDDVLKPVMYEELLYRFPLSDAAFSVAMFSFSLKHIWGDPRGLVDNIEAKSELMDLRFLYDNEEAIKAFVYHAAYIRESIRNIATKCYWVLSFITRAKNHLTWSIPQKFFEMRPQHVGAALASTQINGDFSMFLKQLWLSNQIKHGHRILSRNIQAGITGPVVDPRFPRQSHFIPDIFDPSIVDTNCSDVIAAFDKYFGMFSYFEDALATLTAYMDIDFEEAGGHDDFFTRQDLAVWMRKRLSVSKVRYNARLIKDIKLLLMEHFLCRLGEHYRTSVKTHARIAIRLKTKNPEQTRSRKRSSDQVSESSSSAKRTSASV